MNSKIIRKSTACLVTSMMLILATAGVLEASTGLSQGAHKKASEVELSEEKEQIAQGELFRIYEIVPKQSDASLGYLISGEEPITYQQGTESYTKKLRDMPASAERKLAMVQFKEQIIVGQEWQGLFGSDSFAAWEGEYLEKETEGKPLNLFGTMLEDSSGKGEYIVHTTEPEFQELLPGEVYEGTRYNKQIQSMEEDTDPPEYESANSDVVKRIEGKFIPTFSLSITGKTNTTEITYQKEENWITQTGDSKEEFAIIQEPIPISGLPLEEVGSDCAYINQYVYQKDSSESYTLFGQLILDEATQTVKINGLADGKQYIFTQETSTPGVYSIRFELNAMDAKFPDGKKDAQVIHTVQDVSQEGQTGEIRPEDFPHNPVRNGYEFVEWNTKADATGAKIDANSKFSGNMSVYAIWREQTVSGGDVSGNSVDIAGISYLHEGYFYPAAGLLDGTEFIDTSNLYIMDFTSHVEHNTGIKYYIKNAKQTGLEIGGLTLSLCYTPNEQGRYKMITLPSKEVNWIYEDIHQSVVGTHIWQSDLSQLYDTIWFEGGIHNQNWFINNVLAATQQSETKGAEVYSITMEELNLLSKEELDQADLIYFSCGYGKGDYATDISKEMSSQILRRVYKDQLPIILEHSLVNSSNHQLKILLKTLVCNQREELQSSLGEEFNWQEIEKEIDSLMPAETEYLSGCVYMNDNQTTPYVGKDYLTPKNPEINSSLCLVSSVITKATITQYIIDYGNQEISTKDRLDVLWIEPCNDFGTEKYKNDKSFHLTVSYIANYWATGMKHQTTEELEKHISIHKMTTGEFNGITKELKENYDIIYFGANTGTMNVSKTGENKGYPEYNDSSMNGLIYTHTGDYLDFGILDYPAWDRGPAEVLQHDLVKPGEIFTNRYRFGGNDITKGKLVELKNYIQAGFPVVFHDEFFEQEKGGVNTLHIDSNSYMYDLASFAINGYKGKNVNILTMLSQKVENLTLKEEQKAFKDAVNQERLQVNLIESPPSYKENEIGNNGNVLEYVVELGAGNERGDFSSHSFHCSFFLDMNMDGRFSGSQTGDITTVSEIIKDTKIYEISQENTQTEQIPVDGRYHLYPGRRYKIQASIPKEYTGFLYWKLQFTDNQNPSMQQGVKGNSFILPSEKKEIKILQLMSVKGNTWNLSQDINGENSFLHLAYQIKEFSPQVHSITFKDLTEGTFGKTENSDIGIRALQTAGNKEAYLDYLSQFDLVVIGFADHYQEAEWNADKTEILCSAIQEYIELGNPAIFSNDVTSHYNQERYRDKAGYVVNKTMRGTMGIDAYGVGKNESGSHDYLWFPNKGEQNREVELYNREGYSNPTITRFFWQKGKPIANTSKLFVRNDLWFQAVQANITTDGILNSADTNSGFQYEQVWAQSVNVGQISQYPFALGESLYVGRAHGQSYQLNLEKDDNLDGFSDVVVWYTLADNNQISGDTSSYYELNPKDVKNNYFVYNMGNVSYCGIGKQQPSPEEKKLFINTLVATYQMGVRAPQINVLADETTYQEERAIYFPFDEIFLDQEQGNVSVFFEVNDRNINLVHSVMEAHYYIEERDVVENPKYINGRAVYLKELSSQDGILLYRYDNGIRTPVEGKGNELSSGIRYELVLPFELVFSIQNGVPGRNTGAVYLSVRTNYVKEGHNLSTQESWAQLDAIGVSLLDLK